MRIPDIELANISRFRGALMGIAMLIIIMFHVDLARWDTFYGLRRMGNLGVDMFLFLSGIGLWFSWTKTPSYRHFYFRRLIRIYPAWLIIACLYFIPRIHVHDVASLINLLGEILFNWNFWRYDELDFWYIPAIMMLYLFAPPYMALIRKHPVYRWLPVVMIMWCILVQWVTPIHAAVGHLEIFWSRVPIFFIGINMGAEVMAKRKLDGATIWLIILGFVMPLAASIFLEQTAHGTFPLFIERMLYIPLTVTAILLLNRLLRRTPSGLNRCLTFVGAISLETYLIHAGFVIPWLNRLQLGYWPTFFLCCAITLPTAWVLHRVLSLCVPKNS